VSEKKLSVLGATGSIGLNTIDVAARHPEKYEFYALSAHSNWPELLELCAQHSPRYAVISDASVSTEAMAAFRARGLVTELLVGAEALVEIASADDVDIVMAAIVGRAGLESSYAAASAGKRVLLANKESLVLSGSLFMTAIANSGATILPIDSEHNAIFQCLPSSYSCGEHPGKGVSRVLLTASGGPFRGYSRKQLVGVTPTQACAHPNWSMGKKISVDSASLMNKGLELIEACWLFGLQPKDIEVLIHPQSVIHSMVQYLDGSVLAQLGQPDMRTPIGYGLGWPERIDAGVERLDFLKIASLDFEAPDNEAFPCLGLAREAFERGGYAAAYLNAANEIAVAAFLKGNVRFTSIADIIEQVMARAPSAAPTAIDEVIEADREARIIATESALRFAI
jgi:1-deoxy-D-xylulose-5-phosphate reductoisomerase